MVPAAAYPGGRKGLFAGLVLAALAALPNLPAQPTTPARLTLEQLAPADVFVYGTFAGLKRCAAAAEGVGLYRLWREPEIQRFFAELVRRYEQMAAALPEGSKKEWEGIKRLADGRLSFVVGGITLLWERDHPIPMPGAVLAYDAGAGAERVWGILGQQLERAGASGCRILARKSHGVQVLEVQRTRPFPTFSICFARVGNLVLAGLNRPLLERCLANLAPDARDTLARSPRFLRARSKSHPGPLSELYINLRALGERVAGLVPDEWRRAITVLGLDELQAVYLSSAVGDGDSMDTLYFDAPGKGRGLLGIMSEPLDPGTLNLVPKGAAFAEVGSVDLGRAWDAVMQALPLLLPPHALAEFHKGKALFEQHAGMDIRRDIVGAFGNEWLLYAQLRPANLIPDVVLAVEARDRGRLEALLAKIYQFTPLTCRQVPYREHTLHVIGLPENTPVVPTYTFLGNRLLLSLSPAGLKAALRRLEEKGESILADPHFREAFRGMDLAGAAGIRFLNIKKGAALGYSLAETLLPGLKVGRDFPLELTLLPSVDTVVKHLGCWAEVTRVDEQGMLCRGRTPGLSMFLALAARFIERSPGVPHLILPRLLGPAFKPARRQVRRLVERPGEGGFVNPLSPGAPGWKREEARVEALGKAIAKTPDAGGLYFARGHARHRLRRFDKAVGDFRKALELDYNQAICAYNIACCSSLMGKKEEALRWLEKAFAMGYRPQNVRSDKDLAPLLGEAEFRRLLQKYNLR